MKVAHGEGLFFVNAQISNRPTRFLVDTGAAASIVPSSVIQPTSPSTVCLKDVANRPLKVRGQASLSFSINQLRRQFRWSFVIADVDTLILGADFITAHNLVIDMSSKMLLDSNTGLRSQTTSATATQRIHVILPEIDASCEVRTLLNRFPSLTQAPIFDQHPKHTTTHKIETKDNPPIRHKARPLNAKQLEVARATFDDMLRTGLVRPSSSPWASPLHMVKKQDGTWRPVGDYRAINKVTVPDSYPVPNIEHFSSRLHGAKFFTKLDLVKAYHQIPMDENSIPKSAIITPFGLFEFTRMNFGLKNAGATFQRFIDEVVRDLPFVYTFVDDCVIFSSDFASHLQHLEKVFSRFEDYGLRISSAKCQFAKQQIEFLGFQVNSEGIRPLYERVQSLSQLQIPCEHKSLRRILGMLGFYQRFIPNFAQIVHPLRELMNADTFQWTKKHSESFESIKAALINSITLDFPSPHATQFTITSDASDVCIGSCLHQTVNDQSRPLAFFSRKLSAAERNYSTFDKELLAIFASVKKWHSLLEGYTVTVFSDHKPIVGAFKSNSPRFSQRQQRQLSLISEYVQDIVHIPGSSNVVADTLSREVAHNDEISSDSESIAAIRSEVDVFDLQTLAEEQKKVPDIRDWASQTVEINLPSGDTLVCENSLPYPRPLVPESMQFTIFKSLHELGHPGIRRSMKLIKDRFVWPCMDKSVKQWCTECQPCQQNKISKHTKSPIQQFPEPIGRFTTVHLDIVGPLPVSQSPAFPGVNLRYIVTFIDRATRWIEAVPVAEITAPIVAHVFFSRWISHFGTPLELITDQGRQFESVLWRELSSIVGFQRIRTCSYHPESNGILERQHRTIKTALRAHITTSRHTWAQALPTVLFSLRIQPLESNGLSPFEMVTGQKIHLPCAVNDNPKEITSAYIQQLAKNLQNISCTTTPRLSNTKTFIPHNLSSSSHVWVRVDRLKAALEAPYTGPYEVTDKKDKIFRVRKLDGSEMWVSVDRLKPAVIPSPKLTLPTPEKPAQPTVATTRAADDGWLTIATHLLHRLHSTVHSVASQE